MNAQEFIKQHGWGKAKLVISEWNNYFNQYEVIKMPTHYDSDLEIFIHEYDFESLDESDVCISDLKQLVDAWELVEKNGGLENSKDNEDLANGLGFGINGLKKAIELVESVG